MSKSKIRRPNPSCNRSWSISEESLWRYVHFASHVCIQELLSASVSDGFERKDDAWKVITVDIGVQIFRRRTGSFHAFYSQRLLKFISPDQFIAVATAINTAKPLLRNREFIIYERHETMDDGTLVVVATSLPKEIAEGLQPKQAHVIRGLLIQSGWVVEKVDVDSCMVTCVFQVSFRVEPCTVDA